jgi:hypothetical protein
MLGEGRRRGWKTLSYTEQLASRPSKSAKNERKNDFTETKKMRELEGTKTNAEEGHLPSVAKLLGVGFRCQQAVINCSAMKTQPPTT